MKKPPEELVTHRTRSGRLAIAFTYIREQHYTMKWDKEPPAQAVASPTGTVPPYLSRDSAETTLQQQLQPQQQGAPGPGCTRSRVHPKAAAREGGWRQTTAQRTHPDTTTNPFTRYPKAELK